MDDKVKIGAYEYSIVFVENLHSGESDLYGQVLHHDLVIQINSAYKKSPRLMSVLIHETIHAILEQAARDDIPEEVVRVLGVSLAQVFTDNRWIGGDL